MIRSDAAGGTLAAPASPGAQLKMTPASTSTSTSASMTSPLHYTPPAWGLRQPPTWPSGGVSRPHQMLVFLESPSSSSSSSSTSSSSASPSTSSSASCNGTQGRITKDEGEDQNEDEDEDVPLHAPIAEMEIVDVGSAGYFVVGQRPAGATRRRVSDDAARQSAAAVGGFIAIDHLSIEPQHAVLQYAARPLESALSRGHSDGSDDSGVDDPLGVSRGVLDEKQRQTTVGKGRRGGRRLPREEEEEPCLYVYDMGSAHGTFVNDRRLPPREFHRLNWGDVLRFGECPRPYTLVRRRLLLPAGTAPLKSTVPSATALPASSKKKTSSRNKMIMEDDDDEERPRTEESESIETEDSEMEIVEESTDESSCDHLNQDEDGETPHILCVDVGTTGLRAYAYDVSSRRTKSSKGSEVNRPGCRNRGGFYRRLPTLYPQPGWVEQDPHIVWETLIDVVNKVLQRTRISASQVKALGITTQRASFLLWHKDTGQPLCNFITWQDIRAAGICEEWNESVIFKGIHTFSKFAHMVTRRSRHLMGSIFKFATTHCTPRLIWAMKNIEGAQQLANEGKLLFGTTDTWLLWNLTGGKIHATDYSNASATGLYDTFELQWNQQLFSVVGLPPNILPEVKPTSGDFGSTMPKLFGAAIPIRAIVADQQAALFGECCFDVGDCKVTIGTGCFIDINTGSQPCVSTHGLSPLIAWAIGNEVTYMIEGTMPSVGSVIDWGSKEMGWYKNAKETEAMATSVSDTRGVYFVPAFAGLSAPQQDPTARGTILGMTTATKKEHIVRALLESIGYTCTDLLETMKTDLPDLRISPLLKVDGGVSQNNFVNQFIANMTGREIIRHPNPDQITAFGAAFLAGLGAGIWKSKEELKSLRASLYRVTPQIDQETRNAKHKTWKIAVERSMHWAQDSTPLTSPS